MKTQKYGKLTAGIVFAWFALALTASASHLFRANPNAPPLALGVGALIPLVLFVLWFAISNGFRQFVLSLNPSAVTNVHSWRVVGFVFLVLYSYGILPGIFALPAGWGDIAIGATAPLVALKLANPEHRKSFMLWQILGISDLVMAMILAATASLIDPHGVPTNAMTVLPLSLIPTFGVPLLLCLHIVCIAQATRWKEPQQLQASEPLPARA